MRALDAELSASCHVILIGGTALSFYAKKHFTDDIDIVAAPPEFQAAYDRLEQKKTVRMLPLQHVGVHHQPEGTEDRWQVARFEPQLRFLAVSIPERHDLALMKIARGLTHDREGVYEMHSVNPFDLETLIQRYNETWVTGQRSDFQTSFFLVVEHLFGKAVADEAERRLV